MSTPLLVSIAITAGFLLGASMVVYLIMLLGAYWEDDEPGP